MTVSLLSQTVKQAVSYTMDKGDVPTTRQRRGSSESTGDLGLPRLPPLLLDLLIENISNQR